MKARLRLLLSVMMFLEYAAWGAWMPILSGTLTDRHFQPVDVGNIYSALWLGCILSPFLGGQLVDRFMPSQIFLAITHILGAGAAFMMAHQTTPAGVYIWMLIWALLFAPSLGITNSIAFEHIERLGGDEASRERDFSLIRTSGTIGWIAAGFILAWYLNQSKVNVATGAMPELMLTAILGVVMGIFCFFLPNTPPAKDKRVDPLAFRRALGLFKSVPGFAVFMIISFVAATEFQFFYLLSAPYLETLHIPHSYIPVVKSISQVTEIAALGVLLPLWLPKKGMRWCLLIGSFAWPLRYIIFAIGQPIWLVVASLGLHGFGYAFVLVVQQLYVDRVSPRDIRGSAQSLLTLLTLGIGNWLGTLFCGMVQQYFTHGGVTQWVPVFVLPTITTLVCAIAYMFTFHEPKEEAIVAENATGVPV